MYFIEYALREAIDKAITEAIKKINSSPKSTKPGEQDFKVEEMNILNDLKTEVLALSIAEQDTPDLDTYLTGIQSACLSANDKAKVKAETFRKAEANTGSTFDSARMSKEFTAKFTNIINNIVKDFTPSSTRFIDFEAFKFIQLSRFTEETHGKDWLCHFIRRRFDYKTSKLALIHISNEADATYKQKIENIDSAYHNWGSLQVLYCNYMWIREEAESTKTTLESLLPSSTAKASTKPNLSARVTRGKAAASEQVLSSDEQELAPPSTEHPVCELIRRQERIIHLCNKTLLDINGKILNQAILGFVQILKDTDKSIQVNNGNSSFFNHFIPTSVSEGAVKVGRSVGVGRGLCDSLFAPYLTELKEFVNSAEDTTSLISSESLRL